MKLKTLIALFFIIPTLALAGVFSDNSPKPVQGVAPMINCTVNGSTCVPAGTNNPMPITDVNKSGSFLLSACSSGCDATLAVQAAAYSAGNAVGNILTMTGSARTNGGSGSLMGFRVMSTAGLTPTLWVYGWSKTPQSTCTDKQAFSRNAADNAYLLPGFPQSITLASPGSFDTSSFASLNNLSIQFKNKDSSPGTAIYFCLVTAGSVTFSQTTDLNAVINGVQD